MTWIRDQSEEEGLGSRKAGLGLVFGARERKEVGL